MKKEKSKLCVKNKETNELLVTIEIPKDCMTIRKNKRDYIVELVPESPLSFNADICYAEIEIFGQLYCPSCQTGEFKKISTIIHK